MLCRQVFADPPSKYRPIPFWFWNSKMRKPEVEAQIRDFHAKGIGGFFVHARFGLETGYLSDEWMDCLRHAIAVASELDMEVWLYDENGFPSGIGDLKIGRVPEYRAKFIDVTEGETAGGETLQMDLPAGDLLMAYAYPCGNPGGPRIDLMGSVSRDRLSWNPPDGEWSTVVYSKCRLEDPNDVIFGVDYLNPEAMRAFFDLALEPYDRAVGEHFGKTIKGVFTDEPTLLAWHHELGWYANRKHARVVAWDDLIEQKMIERVKLSAREFLPHLFFGIDGTTAGVRRAFWQVVSDLYIEAFFKPYSEWCEKRGLKFTGHVLFEEGLCINTDFQADYAANLAYLHIPGTDHLGEATEGPYGGGANLPRQLTNAQGEKLAVSIAHYMGREACISETYGCAGWGLSFEKMKWIADWQYSLGINMLCPHAVFYSIEGFRKSDAPPSENHMAGWPHYRQFADYIGRLSYVLREGRHKAKVALFYPLKGFWGEHTVGKVGVADQAISDAFDLCASLLMRLHFDYDILPEQALAIATIEGGKIRLADEEYEVLIAPETIVGEVGSAFVGRLRDSGGIVLNWPTATGDHKSFAAELDAAIRCSITPDVEIRSANGEPLPDVRYVHREIGDTDIYFAINTSDQPAQANLSLETVGYAEEWNPETGEIAPAEDVEIVDGRLVLKHGFQPYGSTVYVIDRSKPTKPTARVERIREDALLLPDQWEFRTEQPNALPLGQWAYGIRVDGAGEEFTYSTTFNCESVPDGLLMMLDDIEYRASLMGGMDLTVSVNDRSWRRPEFGWYLDKGFKTLDITEAVRVGENSVRIVIKHSSWSGQPHLLNAPAVLLGDFACDPDTRTILRPARTAKSGSWTSFGYPFYSGTSIYSQAFEYAKEADARRAVVAVDSVRDMVEIVVNGRSAAVRLWRPWEAEVTDLLVDGRNNIEIRVTNSMQNFLESTPRESGLTGRVRILHE